MNNLILFQQLTDLINKSNNEIINYQCISQNTTVKNSNKTSENSSHTGYSAKDVTYHGGKNFTHYGIDS